MGAIRNCPQQAFVLICISRPLSLIHKQDMHESGALSTRMYSILADIECFINHQLNLLLMFTSENSNNLNTLCLLCRSSRLELDLDKTYPHRLGTLHPLQEASTLTKNIYFLP